MVQESLRLWDFSAVEKERVSGNTETSFSRIGYYRDCRARDQNSLKFRRRSAFGCWGEDHNSLDFPSGSLWVFLDRESGWCKRE